MIEVKKSMQLHNFIAFALAGFGLAAAGPATAQHTLANTRISITFADPATGFSTLDNDRIDSVSWINSAGSSTGNLASNATGGPFQCNDPDEFFGEAEGYPDEGQAPEMVTVGEVSTWHGTTSLKGSISTKKKGCKGATQVSALTTSAYSLSSKANTVNSVKIVRTFKFGPTTPIFTNTGLRAYMARVPISVYHYTILPNAAGAITVYDANNCSSPCSVTDWNGTWLAEDDGSGNGVAIVRSASSTNPAFVGIDSDGYSQSNVSSVVLSQPGGGWTAPVKETEYLCFYDPTSWPAASQAAGKLPTGCRVK